MQIRLIKSTNESWTLMQDKPAGTCRDCQTSQLSFSLQAGLLLFRVSQVNKMIGKKAEAKKNSDLQKVLGELEEKIEVGEIGQYTLFIILSLQQSERREECILCIRNKRNCALQPCGHKDLCSSCAERLDGKCHQCREKIESILLTYSQQCCICTFVILNEKKISMYVDSVIVHII